jgi:hypothetical protein
MAGSNETGLGRQEPRAGRHNFSLQPPKLACRFEDPTKRLQFAGGREAKQFPLIVLEFICGIN